LTAAAGVHPFVELLGDAHGAAGGKTEPARGLLLQRGGDERRLGAAAALTFLDARHREATAGGLLDPTLEPAGLIFAGDIELLDLVAVELDQVGAEGIIFARSQIGLDGPVLL